MDSIAKLYDSYVSFVQHLKPHEFSFILRATVILAMADLACFAAWHAGSRSAAIQCLVCGIAVLFSAGLPVERIGIENRTAKAWLFTICLVLLATLPSFLPLLLTPTYGTQRKLRVAIYALLLLLLVANQLKPEGFK